MKKILTLSLAALICFSATAQLKNETKPEGFQFTTVKELPITSVKNQASTGTCWCFAALSFFESEALRQGYKGDLDLAEMFVVSNAYTDKAIKYIRVDGHLNFAQGSSFGDVLCVLKEYGIVPNSVMPGLNYGTDRHMHGELAAGLKGYVDGIRKNPNRKLSTAWIPVLKAFLAAYLGPAPETFEYEGKQYTPRHTWNHSVSI